MKTFCRFPRIADTILPSVFPKQKFHYVNATPSGYDKYVIFYCTMRFLTLLKDAASHFFLPMVLMKKKSLSECRTTAPAFRQRSRQRFLNGFTADTASKKVITDSDLRWQRRLPQRTKALLRWQTQKGAVRSLSSHCRFDTILPRDFLRTENIYENFTETQDGVH